eukprot:942286-Pyramimonas_sp.AAC.1
MAKNKSFAPCMPIVDVPFAWWLSEVHRGEPVRGPVLQAFGDGLELVGCVTYVVVIITRIDGADGRVGNQARRRAAMAASKVPSYSERCSVI